MKELTHIKLGPNIKSLRLKNKITQEQLSFLTNIDYKYIQKIESKNPPNITLETLARIAKALKTTPSRLLGS